jgi:hypothetical protein
VGERDHVRTQDGVQIARMIAASRQHQVKSDHMVAKPSEMRLKADSGPIIDHDRVKSVVADGCGWRKAVSVDGCGLRPLFGGKYTRALLRSRGILS